jgi:uncharacterized repeat protein (TIGR02543 family)
MNRKIRNRLIRGLVLGLLVLAIGACTVTLSAQYFTVTYNGNGALGSAPVDSTYYVQGDTVTVLGQGSLTRSGYVFSGWNQNANGSGTTYTPGQTFTMGNVGITLYAVWSVSPSYIRISNTSGIYTLAHVYITMHSSSSWGGDLLSPAVVTPGNFIDFQVGVGNYDVWVTDTTPYDAYAYNVAVAAGTVAVLYFNGTTLAP